MSRTYRKTKKKQGAPKRSQRNFNQFQLDMIDIPAPRREPNKYVFVAEVVTVPSNTQPPEHPKDPRWCTKGTPHAIPEYHTVQRSGFRASFGGIIGWTTWNSYEETGRYYLPKPEYQVERKRWKREREIIDYSKPDWREKWNRQWNHRQVFEHVHKNQTGGSRRAGEWAQYLKRQERRAIRREGVSQCRNWEDEYFHNEHLLPFIYCLDDSEFDDYWDDYDALFLCEPEWEDHRECRDNQFYDDLLDSLCDEDDYGWNYAETY